jgi:adenylate kinase family enzyme
VLANDEGRPICDRYLVELILGGTDFALRAQVAGELEPEAPLVKYGLVRVLPAPPDQYLFAGVTVEPVLLSRLRGNPHAGAGAGAVTVIRRADRSLAELTLPATLKRDLTAALAEPLPPARPLRLVLRGRPGSGRSSLAAALVERSGKHLALFDCERLPRASFAAALRAELGLSLLRGAVPCVAGLEIGEGDDRDAAERIREVLRSHPGPLVVRTSPEHRPPLDPGYLSFTLPPMNEGERGEFWRAALARRALRADGVDKLAARFRVGPGTIERIVAQVALRRGTDGAGKSPADATDELDRAARQHIDVRLAKVATQVDRLARWEQVALPDDTLDSIKEFIGRVKHRRTVYESWGFDRKVATARGLVALFYGPPGTGKTMVAGLIARELGLDLFRVDLARITSKWIGETEKNLGEIFDAAEDGQALILFDEADSLFAKRTEVKSSVDRYANLEVNYLLQRLDSFEGIAILTTNLEGSIDQAFKRRLSLRLAFPFPDEDMRVRLWAAHIPPEVPTKGDFDFADLARRFPMSGGYIRNSALRAAFLAAQEGAPLAQDHLQRAIGLEYREMGKLSAGGRME